MLSIRPFLNFGKRQRVPTICITSTYMLAAFFTGVLITITIVIELLSAQEELVDHSVGAAAHVGAAPTRRGRWTVGVVVGEVVGGRVSVGAS
jgi:hypothetical protein